MRRRRSLSGLLRFRKKLNFILGIFGVVILVLSLFFIINRPKKIEASVVVTGDYAVIDGGNSRDSFVIDDNGYVYQKPAGGFVDDNGNEIDVRYSSYLATPVTCGSEICNVTAKSLTVRNSMVLVEGSQDLKNLTVENSGSISQPFADRSGMLNKPVFAGDYWGIRLTGFLKIPQKSTYFISADEIDDAVKVESFSGSNISLGGNNNWTAIYVDASGSAIDGWNSGVKLNLNAGDFSSSGNYNLLRNTGSSDIWVPIRLSFADTTGFSQFKLKYQRFESSDTALSVPGEEGFLSIDDISGIDSNGDPMGSDGWGYMDTEYFLSQNGSTIPNSSFTNAIKTFLVDNLNLKTALASPYGFVGSADQTFKFAFDTDDQVATPLGDSDAGFHRTMASRYSNYPLNPNIFPADTALWPNLFKNNQNNSRRIDSGLTLNIENEMKIEGERGINLNGVGYPGWGNEFKNSGYSQQRGAGTGGGESSDTLGAGASYARSGGAPSGTFWGSGKNTYGDASENIGKSFNGSGGGSSRANIGGSGGGSLKISTPTLTIRSKNAIESNGNGGIAIANPKNVSGGSGGKIVIKATDLNIESVDSSSVKNPVASSRGYGFSIGEGVNNVSAGSGGYIILIYDNSNDNDINAGIYSIRLAVNGGVGVQNVTDADIDGDINSLWNGQDGIISVVRKTETQAATIKKWLLPIDRPNETGISNANFNPYSLQLNDVIQVNLEVSNLSVGIESLIEDEILKIYGSTERCEPIAETIIDPPNSTITESNYDFASGEVFWKFVPNASGSVNMSYNCRVVN